MHSLIFRAALAAARILTPFRVEAQNPTEAKHHGTSAGAVVAELLSRDQELLLTGATELRRVHSLFNESNHDLH